MWKCSILGRISEQNCFAWLQTIKREQDGKELFKGVLLCLSSSWDLWLVTHRDMFKTKDKENKDFYGQVLSSFAKKDTKRSWALCLADLDALAACRRHVDDAQLAEQGFRLVEGDGRRGDRAQGLPRHGHRVHHLHLPARSERHFWNTHKWTGNVDEQKICPRGNGQHSMQALPAVRKTDSRSKTERIGTSS